MGSCKSIKQALSPPGAGGVCVCGGWGGGSGGCGGVLEKETGLKGSLEEQVEVAWETIERRCTKGDMSG